MKTDPGGIKGIMVSIVIFLMLCAVPVLGGEKGVTENSIKIGASLDMTGPTAFVGKALSDGMNVYFSAVMSEKLYPTA
jgi:hypothetical protein